jgi:alternate signal-mediated exported protein
MKKSTKGALAAAAAGSLLLGGAGSLAYWTATGTVGTTTITSGNLGLSNPDCDPGVGTAAVWTIDGGTAFNPATDTIVPGDVLTEVCTFTVTASGKHLVADITTTGGTDAGGNALETAITPVASYTVNNAAATQVTSANNGHTLKATVSVTFPKGAAADETTKNLTETLTDYVITLTQNHS